MRAHQRCIRISSPPLFHNLSHKKQHITYKNEQANACLTLTALECVVLEARFAEPRCGTAFVTVTWHSYLKFVLALGPCSDIAAASYALAASSTLSKVPIHLQQMGIIEGKHAEAVILWR